MASPRPLRHRWHLSRLAARGRTDAADSLDKKGCIFVLGADRTIIQQAVAKHYSEAGLSAESASDYLEKIMVRITYVGAGFLALVAILPTIISSSMQLKYDLASFYGGTSLLIAVSVAFDVVQKIDSHLVMRNYRGLLEKG